MISQKELWNGLQAKDLHQGDPSGFVQDVLKIIPDTAKILELGCGAGNDSVDSAKAGHLVTATDFSEVAVKKNTEFFSKIPNLNFQLLDISRQMNFPDNEYNVVYARLSLHYFTDETTRKVFKEIYRVVKPNGYLCFLCKSTDDPLYGEGIKVEADMYNNAGHIRHFFSESYVRLLLDNIFTIEKLEMGREVFYTPEQRTLGFEAQG